MTTMSLSTGVSSENGSDSFPALTDFNDGFSAGYRGEPKEKGRSITYNNAYARGVEAERRA